jgi:hypothetical protein
LIYITNYFVKSAYAILSNVETQVVDSFFKKIWKSHVPSYKRLLAHDRIPSTENLLKRGVLEQQGIICGVCEKTVESTSHIFSECNLLFSIRSSFAYKVGVSTTLHKNCVDHYKQFTSLVSSCKKQRRM